MRNPDEFDAFYRAAQHRLLLQTYALTGDLPASRGAVRDAFVAAWHHWRKVSSMSDPESYVRPHAWLHAQRRHSARIWHRDKSLDPEIRATLDALAGLSVNQRKALLLTQTSTITMAQMAREVGLTDEAAETQLQSAAAQFALQREIPTTMIRHHLQALEKKTNEVRFPRPSIIRRAGATRRRAHTTAGALAMISAVLASGTIVAQDDGVAAALRDINRTGPRDTLPQPDVDPLDFDDLLTKDQVALRSGDRSFSEPDTSDNTGGNGINVICQQQRFADPKGLGALVRKFPASGKPTYSVVQSVEQSAGTGAASKAYDTTVRWYAGCLAERVQLLSARAVTGVGDEAMLLVLRGWTAPVTTYTVAVARTGSLTTSVARVVGNEDRPALASMQQLLTTSVTNLCHHEGSGACIAGPMMREVPPPPADSAKGMLQVVDLPPASALKVPWVGTDPDEPTINPAATPCDKADFTGQALTFAATRSFLAPQASLPDRFGLSETVGRFRTAKAANEFVGEIAARMASCEDRRAGRGSNVDLLHRHATKRSDIAVWHQVTDVSDDTSISYWMAIVRTYRAVAQVTFVPAPRATIGPADFRALAERAQARLANLPPE